MKQKEQKQPVSKAKKIYSVVSTALVALIFVFLVIVVAVMLVQRSSGGETTIFGYRMYDVLTDSMSGTIEPGEVIVCKEVEDVNILKVGDIITFKAPNGDYNETHRIIEIVLKEDGSVDYLRTQGDNSLLPDNWRVPPQNVKAIYVRKSVIIGGLRSFLSNWYGYVVLIVIPMCIVLALVIAGFVKDKVALEREEMKKDAVSLENISEEDKQKLLALVLEDTNKTSENTLENGEKTSENNGEIVD